MRWEVTSSSPCTLLASPVRSRARRSLVAAVLIHVGTVTAFNPAGSAASPLRTAPSLSFSRSPRQSCCMEHEDEDWEIPSQKRLPRTTWPTNSGKLYRFMPTEESGTFRTPDKFQGSRKDGAFEGSFEVRFTLPDRDDESKTIALLRSTDQDVPSFGAVRVKLPLDATVAKTDSNLVVKYVKEDGNAEYSRIREGDVIRAMSVPETGADTQADVPWWGRIGRTPVPDAEEGMVILDDRPVAEYKAVLEENLRVNGRGSEVVLLIERLTPEDEPGKFVRVGDSRVPHAFGQRAVVVGGYEEGELEQLDSILDSVGENAIIEMPVIVLAQEDSKITMKNLISQRRERDHVLPSTKPMNIEPFVLFSGLPMPRVKDILNGMRALGLPPSAVALAVPGAMDKTMRQLTNEVIDDFNANRGLRREEP